LPADKEGPGASRAQGEGDSPGGDEVGLIEPVAPASGSGLAVDPPSPPDRRLLPSLGVDEGVMDEPREAPQDVRPSRNSPRVESEILPSEVGTSPPARVRSITQGRMSSIGGVRYRRPLHPPPPSPSVRPTFRSRHLPFEPPSSGLRFLEEGIHSGRAQEPASSSFGESYQNEVPRVNPLFTIDGEAEPPEGVIPVEESDIPVYKWLPGLAGGPGGTGCHRAGTGYNCDSERFRVPMNQAQIRLTLRQVVD